MTIYVKRVEGGRMEVRDGYRRLRVALSVFGYAHVTDMETDEQLTVQEVDGQIVVMSLPAAGAETMAADDIERAAY